MRDVIGEIREFAAEWGSAVGYAAAFVIVIFGGCALGGWLLWAMNGGRW